MNKKGRIIMGLIAFALVAVAAVLLILNTVNRATKVLSSDLLTYLDNAQYYIVNEEGKEFPTLIKITILSAHTNLMRTVTPLSLAAAIMSTKRTQ